MITRGRLRLSVSDTSFLCVNRRHTVFSPVAKCADSRLIAADCEDFS